jgi:nitrate/nitrite transport system permease protein
MKEQVAAVERSWFGRGRPGWMAPWLAQDSLRRKAAGTLSSAAWMAGGVALLVAVWAVASAISRGVLPGPLATLAVFGDLLGNAFRNGGPNDKGIGLQLASSIGRVLVGFALGSLVAIPAGVIMGASPAFNRLLYPIVQLLKPVSPLAWFPIGLAVSKSAGGATIFVIVITSLWATLVNTAFGVGSVPQDHKNVGRAFGFSHRRYVTKILIPYALPHIMTGLRLSLSVAWLVIVAGEMLSGGIGIGFFVWDSWNALSLERVCSAIMLIGIVGLVLDRGFELLSRRVAYDG